MTDLSRNCLIRASALNVDKSNGVQNENIMSNKDAITMECVSPEVNDTICDPQEELNAQKPNRTYKRSLLSSNVDKEFIIPKKTIKAKETTIKTVSTENYFTPLAESEIPSTHSNDQTSDSIPSKEPKPLVPPPLVVENKCVSSRLLAQIKSTLKSKYTSSYNTQGLRIQCSTREDFTTLQYFLTANKMQFFSYHKNSEQLMKVVLRGLPPNISEQEILVELQELQIPATAVRQFKRTQIDPLTDSRSKVPLPLWVITMHNQPGIHDKMKELTGLFNLRIKIEDYSGSSTPMQCFRCQRFGHKAQWCNLQPKCVKCAGSHHTRECVKDPTTPATCSNCNGSHPANFRQCPRFIAYTKPSLNTQPTMTSPPAPDINNSNFPQVRPARGTISGFQRPNDSTNFETNNNAMSDIKDIFNFFKSMNIKQYIRGIKSILNDVSKQKDPISKCMTLISGICSLIGDDE